MINAYVSKWKRFLDFGGKSKRAEFWWNVLMNLL